MKQRRIGTLLRLIISIALLLVLFLLIDREALVEIFLSVDIPFFLAGLLFFVGTILTWTLRWHLLMRAAGEAITYWKSLHTLTIGMFFSMFLPTIVGTDVGRVYELGRDDSYRRSNLVSTVVLDRLMGLLTISMMAVGGLIAGSQFAADQGIVLTVLGTLAVLIFGWVIVFNARAERWIFSLISRIPIVKRFRDSLHRVYKSLDTLYRRPRLMATAGSVSVINSLCTIVATYLAARSIGVDINPIYFFIFMPIIWIIITIPVSLSGLGVREGAFVFFFSQVGVASSAAIAISLLYYAYNVVVGAVGGLLLLSSSLAQARRRRIGEA
ncbi:MAG: flippase-like domain-containing protein [Anaerolineae bacterium]|nr:flippase-like domain-containing protein [Anaerolineae bacterium]